MRRYALIFACAFSLAPPAWAVSTAELDRQVQALQQVAANSMPALAGWRTQSSKTRNCLAC